MSTVFTASQTACIGCGCLALGIIVGVWLVLQVGPMLVFGPKQKESA